MGLECAQMMQIKGGNCTLRWKIEFGFNQEKRNFFAYFGVYTCWQKCSFFPSALQHMIGRAACECSPYRFFSCEFQIVLSQRETSLFPCSYVWIFDVKTPMKLCIDFRRNMNCMSKTGSFGLNKGGSTYEPTKGCKWVFLKHAIRSQAIGTRT